jgi:hypothetical protein
MAAKARLSFACAEPRDLQDMPRRSIGNAVAMQRVVSTNCVGVGLDHERSAMSRAKSPISNFGSGNTRLRAVVTTAAAALIGTLVGGASVLGIVTAVTQPPAHDINTDAQHRDDGNVAPAPSGQAATPPPQTAPVVAERQSAPPAEGFRAVWPDALSARANHGSEPAPATPAPQQALPPANDRSALNQSEQFGTGRGPYAANSAAPARDSLPNQISPNTAPAKKRVVATPPGPSADRAVDEMSAGNASVVYPPQRRGIIVPGPDQAANEDRGHWGGGGGGLFDFFGQNHSDGDHWSQDHWNNDWHD